MTRAFSSRSGSNSGSLMEARAVSGFGQREDGTGQPQGPSRREGASGMGESVTSSAVVEGVAKREVSMSSAFIAESDADDCSSRKDS